MQDLFLQLLRFFTQLEISWFAKLMTNTQSYIGPTFTSVETRKRFRFKSRNVLRRSISRYGEHSITFGDILSIVIELFAFAQAGR